jgi:hypothetical protein
VAVLWDELPNIAEFTPQRLAAFAAPPCSGTEMRRAGLI